MPVAKIPSMRLDCLFAKRTATLSFEFFPTKTDRAWYTLEDTIDSLAPLGPDFVSVTYGAGGSTRSKTREVIEYIQKKTSITAMAHLTCVNATQAELRTLLDEYAAAGIENLLALRGDPPKGETRFTPTDGGCAFAKDLVDLIRADGRFASLCAAFPERHPDAESRDADWLNLERKFAAGACAGITQCFFDIADWHAMHARFPAARIIPGILPVVDFKALERFCLRCGALVPAELRRQLAHLADDPIAVRQAGIAWTVNFCRQLLRSGAPGLHLYCLNRSTAAAEIVTSLRLSGDL